VRGAQVVKVRSFIEQSGVRRGRLPSDPGRFGRPAFCTWRRTLTLHGDDVNTSAKAAVYAPAGPQMLPPPVPSYVAGVRAAGAVLMLLIVAVVVVVVVAVVVVGVLGVGVPAGCGVDGGWGSCNRSGVGR